MARRNGNAAAQAPSNDLADYDGGHVDLLFPGNFLKGGDLHGGVRELVIAALEPRHELKSTDKRTEYKLVLWFEGEEKGMVCNKTNAYRIAAMWGPVAEKWVGKPIKLTTERVSAFGKTHNAIRVVDEGNQLADDEPRNGNQRGRQEPQRSNARMDQERPADPLRLRIERDAQQASLNGNIDALRTLYKHTQNIADPEERSNVRLQLEGRVKAVQQAQQLAGRLLNKEPDRVPELVNSVTGEVMENEFDYGPPPISDDELPF